MRRFWFEFDAGTFAQFEERNASMDGGGAGGTGAVAGIGVTGRDEFDAREIVRSRLFDGRPLPPISRVIADVDVSTLGEHVLSNMEPPIWRGVWFPLGYAEPPTAE